MKSINVTIGKCGRDFYNKFIRKAVKRVVLNSLDSRADQENVYDQNKELLENCSSDDIDHSHSRSEGGEKQQQE